MWRQRARRRAQKSEGSANENGTNDENGDGNGEEKVCFENYRQIKKKILILIDLNLFAQRSGASDHVAIALEEAVIEDNDNKAKMVRNQARAVKQLVMMEHHVVEMRPTEDVDASTNVISVSVSLATKMPEMESRKMATMLPTVMLAGKESHAFAHAIDQTRTEAVNR